MPDILLAIYIVVAIAFLLYIYKGDGVLELLVSCGIAAGWPILISIGCIGWVAYIAKCKIKDLIG